MTQSRTAFAASPPEPRFGQVFRWPLDVFQLDTGDAVLLRHRGENAVFDSPAILRERLRTLDQLDRRAGEIAAFDAAPRAARLQFIIAGTLAEILIGVAVGIPFAALFAKVLLS